MCFAVGILVQLLEYKNDAKLVFRWFVLQDRYFYCRIPVTGRMSVLLGKLTVSSIAKVGRLTDF